MIEIPEKENFYTVDEYLEIDGQSEEKLEYHHGKIIPMSGGTADHSGIAARMIAMLILAIDNGNKPFRIYTSDLKIQVPAYKKFVYADAIVVSEQPEYYEGRKDVITNPLLVAEILSPSTYKFDCGGKFTMYRTLPSLKEYVLVSQDQPMVTTFFLN